MLDGNMIHIIERIFVLVESRHTIRISEWILLFFVAYRRPHTRLRRLRVDRRVRYLTLFGVMLVLQFARISVLICSSLFGHAQLMSGNTGEDEEDEVNDAGGEILAALPSTRKTLERLTAAKLERRWPQSPSSLMYI